MINMPLEQIKERISQKAGLSEQEINDKIKAKLKQLSGLISKEGAAHIIANELGVKLFEIGEKLQIKNILSGMRNVDVTGKVLQTYELREFQTEKHSGKVANMLIGDETGAIRVVLWQKQADNINKLKEGDVVKIKGGYVRDNQGRKEIHLSETSKLIINPSGVEVEVKPYEPLVLVRKSIADIKADDTSIEILATIVQVFDINFFEVCPTCNKRARLREEAFMCPTHGKVDPDYNYVLNLYLDDGTDNIRVVFWRQQVEQLLDMNHSKIMGFKEDPAKFEPVKTDLLGSIVKVSGRANKNQNFDRIELVAVKVDKNPDPDEEIKKLNEEADKVLEKEDKQEDKEEKVEERRSEDTKTPSEPEKTEIEISESQAEPEKTEIEISESQAEPEKKGPAKEKKEESLDDLDKLDLDKELMDIE